MSLISTRFICIYVSLIYFLILVLKISVKHMLSAILPVIEIMKCMIWLNELFHLISYSVIHMLTRKWVSQSLKWREEKDMASFSFLILWYKVWKLRTRILEYCSLYKKALAKKTMTNKENLPFHQYIFIKNNSV